MTDKVLNTLGLARRGGNLAAGEEPVTDACKSRKAKVVLLAADAAANTADRAARLAEESGVPLAVLPYEKDQVGFCLGRSSCALLAVTEAGLAASLLKKLAEADPSRYGGMAAQLEEKARRTQRRKRAKVQEKRQGQAGRKPGAAPVKQSKHGTVK